MARSTAEKVEDLERGHKRFTVIRATIKDDLDRYCNPGDEAILGKKSAEHYLGLNLIQVALPDFEDDDGKDAKPQRTERSGGTGAGAS